MKGNPPLGGKELLKTQSPKPLTTSVTSLVWFVRNSLFNKKKTVQKEESELKFSKYKDKCECTKKGINIQNDHQKAPPITSVS